jgi:hypothetical protein
MIGLSPWASTAKEAFADPALTEIFRREFKNYSLSVHNSGDSLWLLIGHPKENRTALRAAFSPGGDLSVTRITEQEDYIQISLKSLIGNYSIRVSLPDSEQPIVRSTTSFTADEPLFIPFWPRDLIFLGKRSGEVQGKIHTSQTQTRSGLIYLSTSKPEAGSIMYFQNLSALGDYCQETETSLSDVVGGRWPELGFALPPTKERPLPANKKVIISDAFIAFSEEVPGDEFAVAKQYLDLLAAIYLHLPKPETIVHNYPDILDKSLHDLYHCHGCWTHVNGHPYLNAYLCDYKTPPEIMVQLAVLLPLVEFKEWIKQDIPVINEIIQGIPAFYDDKIKSIIRWMPSTEDELDRSEEQKVPRIADSWYLYHPMLHLSRLAIKGDKTCKKLFLDSLEYCIKIAHHFNYRWPVFFNVDTLEVTKEETQPGKGGEKDVAGLYAHVMLQAWQLTKDERYLNEAEKAARSLKDLGLDIFYQANNSTFAASAMLRLWKETKKPLYLDLSYLLLASIFKNMHIWNCNYGYAKSYPTFFSLFPLNDAPYTAVYEEQETFCALHDYLQYAENEDILPSVSLLINEFIRYTIHRAVYYFPPMLPKEMLSEDVKTGEVDPNVWVALEDLHDGWEKSGKVGQEVYGAGLAFGVVPRHYLRVPDEDFIVFADYPISKFSSRKGKPVTLTLRGDQRFECRLVLVKGKSKLPEFTVFADSDKMPLSGKQSKEGNLEFTLRGGQAVKIRWMKLSK